MIILLLPTFDLQDQWDDEGQRALEFLGDVRFGYVRRGRVVINRVLGQVAGERQWGVGQRRTWDSGILISVHLSVFILYIAHAFSSIRSPHLSILRDLSALPFRCLNHHHFHYQMGADARPRVA